MYFLLVGFHRWGRVFLQLCQRHLFGVLRHLDDVEVAEEGFVLAEVLDRVVDERRQLVEQLTPVHHLAEKKSLNSL